MAYLILVRHSLSHQQPGASPHGWHLAEEGRRKCASLAEKLRPYNLDHLYSSDEPKAVETAEGIAHYLGGKPIHLDEHLRETHRETAPYFSDETAFREAVRVAMEHPEELLFGEETFETARLRFSEAVRRLVNLTKHESIALVSHGTILSLYVGGMINMRAFDLWRLLEMPAYIVFTLPDFKLREICFSVPMEP